MTANLLKQAAPGNVSTRVRSVDPSRGRTISERNDGRNSACGTRKAYQDHPPRFAYQLTEKGRKASPIIMALAQWGDTVDAAGRGSAPVEFRDRQNGQPVEIAVVSKKSGRKVPSGRLVAVPGKGTDDLVHWRLGKGRRR